MSKEHTKFSNKKGDQNQHRVPNIFGASCIPSLFAHSLGSVFRKSSSLKRKSSTTYPAPDATIEATLGKSRPVWVDHAEAEKKVEGDQRAYESGMIPMTFEWKQGGREVFLTGTFDHWSKSVLMKPKLDDESVFLATIPLDPKSDIQYKFVVDGDWRIADEQTQTTDSDGNTNNVIFAC